MRKTAEFCGHNKIKTQDIENIIKRFMRESKTKKERFGSMVDPETKCGGDMTTEEHRSIGWPGTI